MADEGRQRLLPRLLDEESGSGEGEPSQGTSRWKGLKRRLNAVSAIKTPGAFPKMIGAEPVDLQKITNSMRQLGVSRPVKVSMYEFGPSALRENREMTNAEFLEVLQGLGPMEQEFKCRYIHIQGLSWDILEALGTKYSIHSLALEDCAHVPQRIKVDYYENMVYASLVSVTIKAKAGEPGTKVLSRVSTRGYSKAELGDSDSTRAPLLKYASGKFAWLSLANMLAALETSQVALLLLKDGTVISMFQEGGDRVLKPIEQKIRTEGTMLRESGDPSFLVHSIIDAIVDLMSEVVDGYAEDVAAVEDRVLRLSDVSTDLIKEIHLIIGELVALRRTIVPLRAVVSSLRAPRADEGATWEPISELSKTFLMDVMDHVDQAIDNIESLDKQSEGLIDLVFNFLSVRTNESMQILAAVSIVFLPITFLSSVFGMNFSDFPQIHDWSITVFWILCAVVLTTTLVILRATRLITWPRFR